MNPFLMTSLLFAFFAVLGAVDAASVSFDLIAAFPGLRWVRVHLITLGIVTQSLFGLLPGLVAARHGLPKPRTRLDIWLVLTTGILTLLFGIPLTNEAIMATGGTLVFAAVLMLIGQLRSLNPGTNAPETPHPSGRRFYITGLVYLLFGIYVGTGLWFGWTIPLGIQVPLEVHIHANNWGLISLVFAGLLVDLYPRLMGKNFFWPGSINKIYWLMTLGALGLVIGPWTTWMFFTVPGLLMHLAGTIWLLLNIIRPLIGSEQLRKPGPWHLISSYVWILAPVLVSPLILLNVPGFPGAGIEQNAPQALVYGWVLQFSYGLLPYFAAQITGRSAPELGGSWTSLILVHLGGVLLWASIFFDPIRGLLHGSAYVLWALSLLPILGQMWGITRGWVEGPVEAV
jgi:hypothetical protein